MAHHNQTTRVKWRVCHQIAHPTPLRETIVISIPFSRLLSFVWALPLGFVCNLTLSLPLFLPQPLCIFLWWFSCSVMSYSCNPRDCCLPVSFVHGISQARMLEWVAISFSRGPYRHRDQTLLSCIGRWILYHGATWEAHNDHLWSTNCYVCFFTHTKFRLHSFLPICFLFS